MLSPVGRSAAVFTGTEAPVLRGVPSGGGTTQGKETKHAPVQFVQSGVVTARGWCPLDVSIEYVSSRELDIVRDLLRSRGPGAGTGRWERHRGEMTRKLEEGAAQHVEDTRPGSGSTNADARVPQSGQDRLSPLHLIEMQFWIPAAGPIAGPSQSLPKPPNAGGPTEPTYRHLGCAGETQRDLAVESNGHLFSLQSEASWI